VHERLLALIDAQLGGVNQLTAQPKQDSKAIERAKQQVRDRIWALLEREGAAKPPGRVVGKIPNFLGAEAAADQLAVLPAWEAAHVVKANPDKAQRPVRAQALADGKVLYMAVPRLADELPFYLLDPEHLSMPPMGGSYQGRRSQGWAEGRRHRAAIGGPGRLRQRGRQPRGCAHRQGRRILRPGGCLSG
jgi:hypothetical protein